MSRPTSRSWASVPEDLLTEFLSSLPVKSLLRFKCVSKSWNTLISNPNFVKFHLKKSKSYNPHFTLITYHNKHIRGEHSHFQTRDTWFSQQKYLTVEQFIIISLDLGTETYDMYTLPRGFVEVLPAEPTVCVLGDCLCFSYYYVYNEAVFIIWQMKKFGDQESWTQFLKISFHDLQLNCDFSHKTRKYNFYIRPLFLSKDGDTLVLHSLADKQANLYNWRDHRVERSGVSVHKTVIDGETFDQLFWDFGNGFVESLISIC